MYSIVERRPKEFKSSILDNGYEEYDLISFDTLEEAHAFVDRSKKFKLMVPEFLYAIKQGNVIVECVN